MIKDILRNKLLQAIHKAFPGTEASVELETPANTTFGDYASNVAMALSKDLKKPPRAIAEEIQKSLDDSDGLLESTSIAGPGFLNFRLKPTFWIDSLKAVASQKNHFGIGEQYKGKKVLVEFVSANPTGPLHIGHGRNAVTGDTLANLLAAVGYKVDREYYINDGGIQMKTLGRSVLIRYLQQQGQDIPFPEDGYQGEYITDIAVKMLERKKEFAGWDEKKLIDYFGTYAGDTILEEIKEDMRQIGVVFENYFFESTLYKEGDVSKVLGELKSKGLTYDQDGALWLKSTQYGDDKDRVLIKKDRSSTYLTPDIAYHRRKFQRGYDLLINVLGADHAGYGPRLAAAMTGLGYDASRLNFIFIQMVSLVKGGEQLSMSTRRAQYETLQAVREAVGADVARYFFMMRSYQSQLEFDLELAKQQTSDNPVYYIQYAHARICSVFGKAGRATEGFTYKNEYATLLNLPEEVALARTLLDYPEVIQKAAEELAPHRVTYYVLELARQFQSYYDKARGDERYRIVSDDATATDAKLFLLSCIRQVIRNALTILGVSAPEKM